ncbi:TPA: helix-turn-helix domain-containing protein, partial [Enterococcus faecium]
LHFYRKSYNYHLIEFMYQHPEKNLEDYADAQYTSVSTVFRYAKLLVKYFEMTDVKE